MPMTSEKGERVQPHRRIASEKQARTANGRKQFVYTFDNQRQGRGPDFTAQKRE